MTARPRKGLRAEAGTVFTARRERFKAALKEDCGGRPAMALVFSGEEKNLTPFTPDSTFYYLTGVQSPGALLFMAVTPRLDSDALLLPATDPAKQRWTGKVLSAGNLTAECQPDALRKEAMEASGQANVGIFQQLEDVLVRPLREVETVYLNFAEDTVPGQVDWTGHFAARLRASHPHLQMRHAGRLVGDLRLVKDEAEIVAMRAAMATTDEAHRAVLGHLAPGMSEFEIQALVEYVFKVRGAETPAFPSIIGSGPFSCTLHYDKNRRTTRKGDLVVCDIGARKGFYCADITRTYPVSGKFTKRQRTIYDTVLRAQDEALSAAKPGAMVKDVHQAATEVIAKAGLGPYFFHGTSHYLGLDPHDAGSYDRPLEPGVVITIEPGIYIATEELGVRIEDDILITPKGAECMTHAPRDPGEIEKALGKPRRTIVV